MVKTLAYIANTSMIRSGLIAYLKHVITRDFCVLFFLLLLKITEHVIQEINFSSKTGFRYEFCSLCFFNDLVYTFSVCVVVLLNAPIFVREVKKNLLGTVERCAAS